MRSLARSRTHVRTHRHTLARTHISILTRARTRLHRRAHPRILTLTHAPGSFDGMRGCVNRGRVPEYSCRESTRTGLLCGWPTHLSALRGVLGEYCGRYAPTSPVASPRADRNPYPGLFLTRAVSTHRTVPLTDQLFPRPVASSHSRAPRVLCAAPAAGCRFLRRPPVRPMLPLRNVGVSKP